MSRRPLALHPMNLADIVDGAFTLFKANSRTLMLVTAAFVVPVQLFVAFLSRDLLGGVGLAQLFSEASFSGTVITSGPGSSTATLVSFATTALVLPVMTGALSRVAVSSYQGAPIAAGPALRGAGRRWAALVGAWILVHLVEVAAGLLFLAPVLAAMALCVAVVPALVTENLGPAAALRRSFRLSMPRLFPLIAVAVATAALSAALTVALGIVPQVAALVVGYERGWVLAAAGSTMSSLVTQPLVVCIATLVYFDGRIRQEGLDVAVLAADLATPSEPSVAPR